MNFRLERDPFGRIILIDAEGVRHEGIVPVRAFPLTGPETGLSLVGADGRERAWIDRIDRLPPALRELLEADLAARDFAPMLTRLHAVSSFGVPSTWTVSTDRGDTAFVLKDEGDIRRIGEASLLVADNHGIHYLIRNMFTIDKHTRKILDRFL